MLTSFGKFCRKLRIDYGDLLKDMAVKLGVTPAYLSAVEVGKRNIPKPWEELIARIYSLGNEEKGELHKAIEESAKFIKMDLERVNEENRDLALTFAREFKTLDAEEIEKIRKVFRKKV